MTSLSYHDQDLAGSKFRYRSAKYYALTVPCLGIIHKIRSLKTLVKATSIKTLVRATPQST